mgnify:CR=1 FL=1
MPLDPQIKAIIEADSKLGLPSYNMLSPAEARKQMLDLSPPVDPALTARQTKNLKIPGPKSEIPVKFYYPDGDSPYPVVVYFHGGGWVIGDLKTHNAICHALTKTSGCLVMAVDYRLAPENKYPAASEDAYAALCWVADNADSIQADANRIAVVGESAGGTLAAVVSMMIRDRGGPQIGLQVLVYPVTNHGFNTPSYLEYAEGYILTREIMKWFWNHHLKNENESDLPYVSPLRAENFGKLPPAFVVTAEYDPLRDEGEAYAHRLQEAGVKVKLSRYDGMIHGFFRMTSRVDRAREALDEVSLMLRDAL